MTQVSHGGRDPGAVSADGRHLEKDNTLSIARAIHGKEPNLPDVQFAYTRLKDKHFHEDPVEDLAARVKFANAGAADLFVSVHQNADKQRRGYGAETYYFGAGNHFSVEGEKLAQAVQTALVRNTDLHDRGVKPTRFYVIRHTVMPAVLVEAGFIGGDPAEAEFVSRPETIGRIAEGIMMGIAEYLGIRYGPAPAWDPQAEIDTLLADGVINTPRKPEQVVNWGEFATVLNRIRR
ncbi:MAG: N-acetylmuramoyl-L-alanine amidase [Firmicutes bacterium]|nr:N-acetylmuramoyl-L-alanine amidase [Bacillota bacterium]